jgi:hypothetical protein
LEINLFSPWYMRKIADFAHSSNKHKKAKIQNSDDKTYNAAKKVEKS